jgi:hypothetical protein
MKYGLNAERAFDDKLIDDYCDIVSRKAAET